MSGKKKRKKKRSIPVYTIQSDGTVILGPLYPGTWELRKVS